MIRSAVLWFSIMVSGIVGALAARTFFQQDPNELFRYGRDLPEVLYLVEQAYVDDVDLVKLMPGAYQGTLETIDENASYIPPGPEPKDHAREALLRTGLVVVKQNGYPYIMTVMPDSPAQVVGIERGNYIRAINKQSLRRLSIYQVRRLLAEQKEELELNLLPPGEMDGHTVRFRPGNFSIPTPTLMSKQDNVFVLSLAYDWDGWAKDLPELLKPIPKGARLVLDLRGNAIGNQKMLEVLAQAFLNKGELMVETDAAKKRFPLSHSVEPWFKDRRVYALIDHTTSGAAEVFAAAGALQGAFTTVGEGTLGLPHFYETTRLQTGGYVRLATRHTLLSDGDQLTDHGYEPQLEVETSPYTEKGGPFLETALGLVKNHDG